MQLVIGLAVGGILSAGMASFYSIAASSQNEVLQRFEVLDLRQQMQRTLDVAVCACTLNPASNTTNSAPLTFDTGGRIELDALYSACNTANPPVPVEPFATKNAPAPGSQTGLRVSNIYLADLQPVGPAGSRQFTGRFEMHFQSRMARQPATVNVRVVAAPGGPPYTVQSCTMVNSAAGGIASFSAAGPSSFTVPAGVNKVYVRVVGGGGGGGGGGPDWAGGGGGAGAYAEGWVTVTPGQSIPVTIGGGGAGGNGNLNGSLGGTGGSTTFGGFVSAAGGDGGFGSDSGCRGGMGGSATLGDFRADGGKGGDGIPLIPAAQGGHGGASKFGGGGRTSRNVSAAAGTAPGSGGGGGYSSARGGNGAPGAVFISFSAR